MSLQNLQFSSRASLKGMCQKFKCCSSPGLSDLPKELIHKISTFLDIYSLLRFRIISSDIYFYFENNNNFWSRIAVEFYYLDPSVSSIYYNEITQKIHCNHKKAVHRFQNVLKSFSSNKHSVYRANLDSSTGYLLRLQGNETKEPISYKSSNLPSLDLDHTYFCFDWNGHYAILIVSHSLQTLMIVYDTLRNPPIFLYSQKLPILVDVKTFCIYQNYLIIMKMPFHVNIYELNRDVKVKHSISFSGDILDVPESNDNHNEILEVLKGGILVIFWFRKSMASYELFFIQISTGTILFQSSSLSHLANYDIHYHVTHRPQYRSTMALNLIRRHDLPNLPDFYLITFNNLCQIKIFPCFNLSCFGMDVTESGQILALVNRRNESTTTYDQASIVFYNYDEKSETEARPKVLYDFKHTTFKVENLELSGWTPEHQIRLCQERHLAFILTNSSEELLCFEYNSLVSSFSLIWKLEYSSLFQIPLRSSLSLSTSKHHVALADNSTIVLLSLKSGERVSRIEMPSHLAVNSMSDSEEDEMQEEQIGEESSKDDTGLGFLLMDDNKILAHYYCPNVFPDTFDIIQF